MTMCQIESKKETKKVQNVEIDLFVNYYKILDNKYNFITTEIDPKIETVYTF